MTTATVEAKPRTDVVRPAGGGIYDMDIHPTTRSDTEIRDYLAPAWHEHFDYYRDFARKPLARGHSYPRAARGLARRDSWPPTGGPPASDLDFMREQHLDLHNIELGTLLVLAPNGNKLRHAGFARAMCSAINDWQVKAWAEPEPRLKGSLVIPQEDIAASLEEIRRWAGSPHFASIFMSPRTDEPIGRERYWPIFELAAELNMTISLHGGGDNGLPTSATGYPSFFVEQRESQSPLYEAVLTSLVMEGVFERFPKLRFFFVEAGGLGWVPQLGWRLDYCWEKLGKEVPHLKKPPTHYMKSNIWYTSQPIDEPKRPADLRKVFDWVGWDRVAFATDYPHWDFDDPRYAIQFEMTAAEKQLFFRDNARAALGLS